MMAIIIFAVSFLGLAVLFLFKYREIKTGEKPALNRLLSRFDEKSERFAKLLRVYFYRFLEAVKFFFLVHLPAKGRVKIENAKESVINKYNKQKDAIMGKKELSKNGASSFFLRKVSENKNGGNGNNLKRGKIEEQF